MAQAQRARRFFEDEDFLAEEDARSEAICLATLPQPEQAVDGSTGFQAPDSLLPTRRAMALLQRVARGPPFESNTWLCTGSCANPDLQDPPRINACRTRPNPNLPDPSQIQMYRNS